MAANTRPYYLIFNGVSRMVEAPNPASAVRHVVGAAVTELRPARGAEVAAWVRNKQVIEVAGQSAGQAEGTAPVVEVNAVLFLPDDAVDWLAEHGANAAGLLAFGDIRREQRMTLEQFDTLRVACPAFGPAIVAAINGDDGTDTALEVGMDDVRGQLEETPFPLDVVIGAIAAAKTRDRAVGEKPLA